jgi:hypothetical protein
MATHCIFILAVDTTLMLAPADDGILLARTSYGKSGLHHSSPVQESADALTRAVWIAAPLTPHNPFTKPFQ